MPVQGDQPPCCQEKAIIVPIVAYCVDLGLPIMLLIISYLFLRYLSFFGLPMQQCSPQLPCCPESIIILHIFIQYRNRRAKLALRPAASSLPLLATTQDTEPAFLTVPCAEAVASPRESSMLQRAMLSIKGLKGGNPPRPHAPAVTLIDL